jgi:isopentenyl diphosphate isomerase/L-lactate dehydrogenase-like FMN-dependent dehydrogenase
MESYFNSADTKAVARDCPEWKILGSDSDVAEDALKAECHGPFAGYVAHGAVIWGLSCDGQRGVEKVLQILRFELDLAMALSGCSTIEEIKRELIIN